MTRIYFNQGLGARFDIVVKQQQQQKKEPKGDNLIMLLKPRESKGEKYLGGVVNAELPTVQE